MTAGSSALHLEGGAEDPASELAKLFREYSLSLKSRMYPAKNLSGVLNT